MSVDGIEEEKDIPARFRRAQRKREGGRGRCRGPRPIMVPHVTCHAPTGPPNSTLLTQPAELLHHHLPLPCACECDTATDPLRPASRLPPPPVTTTLGQVAICLPPPPHWPTLPTTHGVAAIVAVSLCALPHHIATISVSPVPPPAPGGSLSQTVRTWPADCTQSGRRCLAATRRTARHRQGDLCSPPSSRGDTG